MAKKRSSLGKFVYWLRYRVGEYCVRGFVFVMPWVPERFLLFVTSLAARLTFLLLWKYRRQMEENISIALGEEFSSAEKRRTMAWMAWRNFARGVYEIATAVYSSKERIRSTVAVEGEEHLQRALAKGNGVIALSAHLGNFTMIGARLAAGGYPFSVLVKQPRDKRFARLIDHYRAMVGIKTVAATSRREAAREILAALRRNEVVLLIADEFKSGGVEAEFFGRTAPAPRGPVTLALRAGAAILPMSVTRDPKDRLTLHIWPEIDLVKTGDLHEDVTLNVPLLTRQLESMVRCYPDQWNWLGFHRDGRRPRSEMAKSITADSSQQNHLHS